MSSLPADNSCVWIPGPWEHRLVTANGAQFHLAYAGSHSTRTPLVLFVHSYPEYWYAWRHQIEPVAQAGYEVAAVDLRGVGGSDKTPSVQSGPELAQDLISLTESLGASSAVIVAAGSNAALGWAAAAMAPDIITGLVTVASPHPLGLRHLGRGIRPRGLLGLLTSRLGNRSPRALGDVRNMRRLLLEWSAPHSRGAAGAAEQYAAAMRLPEAATSAVEQLRWTATWRRRPSGKAWRDILSTPVDAPVWAVRGLADRMISERAWADDRSFATGSYRLIAVPGAGHFIPEESPREFTNIMLDFLSQLERSARR
ncbi:alpha/beta fold hydrolase [Actinotignum sp. GS-2025f]|uniref:alpha/beta fold hydrolase n=1 Tax=unclassified Actinotignum TaxID=2632702 RepID=UPI002A82FB6D|nr:alpha/beta hydrolase [Actinotignum sp. SLA_B059]MDY5127636.1 alpha/beta hydrolase [Actinotignum sp. SLA_B059]